MWAERLTKPGMSASGNSASLIGTAAVEEHGDLHLFLEKLQDVCERGLLELAGHCLLQRLAHGVRFGRLPHLEAQLGTRHENLADIHHVGKTADYLFSIMDPADDISGGSATAEPDYRPATLARRLEQGPLPTGECRETARQLLAGLAHLHAAGMIHRDVKPANCLWVGRHLKLADLGLLTAANSQASRLGTGKHMPPNGRMDARADVCAAGFDLTQIREITVRWERKP
jgi:serine/threonine protein kinase